MSKPTPRQAGARKQATTTGPSKVRNPPARAKTPARPEKKAKVKKKAGAPTAPELGKVRIKLVRDSFTMPRDDFERIARLKGRAIDLKRPAKKSELLRAGLQVLERLDDAALLATLNALQPIKTGRPKKRH